MFKKFLNLFDSDKEEQKQKQSTTPHDTHYSQNEEEVEEDDDNDNEEEEEDDDEWPEEEIGQKANVELNPETLHGIHYTIEEFDAEVEKRVQNQIEEDKADGEQVAQEDIDNYYFNIRREVYQEWTGANSNMILQWEQLNQEKHLGIAAFGSTKMDENNPLLQPIHGVTIEDYGAISYYIATGADYNAILAQLGIDVVVWSEANLLWAKRMQEDTSFTVVNLFGQYYNNADKHPKLSQIASELSPKAKETLEKLRSDRFFYEELCGARSAAYEYGLDGAQWIMDNYEVSLGEFQKVATEYGLKDQGQIDIQMQMKYSDYMLKMMEEYKQKFAAEQGGNIADDINF